MSLWTMIVAVVAIIFISSTCQAFLRSQSVGTKNKDKLGDLAERLNNVEKRLGNLETIVLDSEKRRSFDEAL